MVNLLFCFALIFHFFGGSIVRANVAVAKIMYSSENIWNNSSQHYIALDKPQLL